MKTITAKTMPKRLDKTSFVCDRAMKAKVRAAWPKGYGYIGESGGDLYFQRNSPHSPSCPCGRCDGVTIVDGPTVVAVSA